MTAALDGKVVLITGAGSGIGRAAAIACAAAGARVVAADISRETAEETAGLIAAEGGTASAVRVDVAVEDDVVAMVALTIEAYGRIDGALNNAGVSQHNLPLHELTGAQWRSVLRVNLDGLFLCVKHEVRAMLSVGGGSIVNTSSALGRVGQRGSAEYGASKGGVIGLTKGAAVDYAGSGIRVNALLPGIVRTPMIRGLVADPAFADALAEFTRRHAMGRLGEPEEIADAAVWLLSGRSSFVTGIELSVDGGYLAS